MNNAGTKLRKTTKKAKNVDSSKIVAGNASANVKNDADSEQEACSLNVSKEAEEEVLLVDLKKIKKDALYKPLLRKFRNFLRKHMESFGLLKQCHYWKSKAMKAAVWDFM